MKDLYNPKTFPSGEATDGLIHTETLPAVALGRIEKKVMETINGE